MELKDLEVYKLARKISSLVWNLYKNMGWQDKKIMGDQWISSVDSIGANIAEGYGRFHYLDKNKFNLNARGSLLEAIHWTQLLGEMQKISDEESDLLITLFDELHLKLNKYIQTTKNLANKREI